jgi:hypothetical protein
VIEGGEVMARLSAACPSWADENPVAAAAPLDGPRDYEPVGAFAHHLVGLGEQAHTGELPAVFAVVEAVLEEGDADAVALIRTGVVEDLQNITSHRDVRVDADDFRRFAGPITTEVWDEIDEAWRAATASTESGHRRPPVEDFLHLAPTERRRIQSMTRELPDGTLAAPSDVLRYEAVQYDEELGRWLKVMRLGPLAYLVLAALLAVAVYVLVR